MQRRDLLAAALALPLATAWGRLAAAATAPGARAAAFGPDTVADTARQLAAVAYAPVDPALPAWLTDIGYDAYRDYRYRPEAALWRGDGLPFQAQFFHRGFLFKDRVDIHVVDGGRSTPVDYARAMFDYADAQVPDDPALGFAGFRLHAALNRPDYLDEVCSFLGASYFRALGRGQAYGLSARGLALGTGEPAPEEFPRFRAFWLERPAPGAAAIVVHALLDGPSAAAAFRFAITPGEETVFDVDLRLYPRVDLVHAGIAPLTSMFAFDAADRLGVDDFRPAVHDSDGLALWNGRGEQAWRPLRNPRTLDHSGFQDDGPRGFGLMQRKRVFADFQDPEAGYDRRPSAWVAPVGDWGRGEVHLVEIPTADEYHDNIVAFWRPAAPLAAGREHRFRYRLHWCRDHGWHPSLARVVATRTGRAADATRRLFVVDLAGGRLAALAADAAPRVQAAASSGRIDNAVAYRLPDGDGRDGTWRMSFEWTPGDADAVEFRAVLEDAAGALGETWLARWPA